MGCLTTEERADYTADLAATIAHITAIDLAISEGLETAATDSYTFDSGTGRQQEKFRSPMELLDRRSNLEAKRDRLRRLLDCRAIIHNRVSR